MVCRCTKWTMVNKVNCMDLCEGLKLAKSNIKSRNYDTALDTCNLLLAEYPDSYEVYELRSSVHFRTSNYTKAFSDLDLVISLVPNDPSPYFRKGRWMLNIGDYEGAISNFTEVINWNSDYFKEAAFYLRALSYLKIKEYVKCLNDCNQVSDGYSLGPLYSSKEEIMRILEQRKI